MEASRLANLCGRPQAEVRDSVRAIMEQPQLQADVKEYPDAAYDNYYPLGLSFCYESTPSVPSSNSSKTLSFIDIFNPPPGNAMVRVRRNEAWFGYSPPNLPLKFTFSSPTIPIPPKPKSAAPNDATEAETMERGLAFDVTSVTCGKEFVDHFGEPTKKGEGEPGYVPPFLEWDGVEILSENGTIMRIGILVELRDPGSVKDAQNQGASIWDRAGSWVWQSLKLFIADRQ